MPNWCYNELKIRGDKKELKKFTDIAKKDNLQESDLLFNNFVTMPKELKGTRSPTDIVSEKKYKEQFKETKLDVEGNPVITENAGLSITKKMSDDLNKKYGVDNWYDWQVSSWGTKWDVNATLDDGSPEDEYLFYNFDTAWAAPIAWLTQVGKQFNKLSFRMKSEYEGEDLISVATVELGVTDVQEIN